jgi:hypothetical protein
MHSDLRPKTARRQPIRRDRDLASANEPQNTDGPCVCSGGKPGKDLAAAASGPETVAAAHPDAQAGIERAVVQARAAGRYLEEESRALCLCSGICFADTKIGNSGWRGYPALVSAVHSGFGTAMSCFASAHIYGIRSIQPVSPCLSPHRKKRLSTVFHRLLLVCFCGGDVRNAGWR